MLSCAHVAVPQQTLVVVQAEDCLCATGLQDLKDGAKDPTVWKLSMKNTAVPPYGAKLIGPNSLVHPLNGQTKGGQTAQKKPMLFTMNGPGHEPAFKQLANERCNGLRKDATYTKGVAKYTHDQGDTRIGYVSVPVGNYKSDLKLGEGEGEVTPVVVPVAAGNLRAILTTELVTKIENVWRTEVQVVEGHPASQPASQTPSQQPSGSLFAEEPQTPAHTRTNTHTEVPAPAAAQLQDMISDLFQKMTLDGLGNVDMIKDMDTAKNVKNTKKTTTSTPKKTTTKAPAATPKKTTTKAPTSAKKGKGTPMKKK